MYVLGLSFDYHDSGVALLKDGKLCSAVEEERFNRKKHSFDFPKLAVEYALAREGITINDVDHIGFYEKPLIKFDRILRTVLTTWPMSYRTWLAALPIWLKRKMRVGREIQKELNTDKDIIFCEHHLSHAASAFLVSPYEEAAIITADGVGEWTTTAVGVGRGTQITIDKQISFPHSIGLFFSALTAYLGFKVNDAEWKVMGLAPYGKPKYVDKFREIVDIKDDGSFRLNMRYFSHHYSDRSMFNRRWETLLGRPRRPRETELDDFHADIAHSGQKIVEEIMVKIAKHAWELYKVPNLCIAGGVGLNCVANWKIRQQTPFQNIFIQPAAGDSGGALGTAFHIYNTLLGKPREFVMTHGCWGPEFTDSEIRDSLERDGAKFERVSDDALADRTAKMLADGKVIGWFQGRMEFGPRALGARSILGDPRSDSMKDTINSKVKFREKFRPFAPAVPKEYAHEWFDMPAGLDLPFMLMVPEVRPDRRKQIPAVTHEDGTGRVQTLTPADNGRFYDLVKRFGELTGVPVLINTSFNVRGEPIVCTPDDAYRTFVNTGIDALVIGNYILTEKPSPVDYAAGLKRSIALEAPPDEDDDAPPPRKRGWLFKIGAMVVSAIIAVAAAEGALRLADVLWPAPAVSGPPYTQPNPRARYYGLADSETIQRYGDRQATYRFNAEHLRGGPVRKGVPSVLVLGDSFVFGALLEEKFSPVAKLNEFAAADKDFGPGGVQFLDGALGGWGTADYLAYLEEFGPRLSPKAVVVILSYNDIDRSVGNFVLPEPDKLEAGDGPFERPAPPPPPSGPQAPEGTLKQWLHDHSKVVQLLAKAREKARGATPYTPEQRVEFAARGKAVGQALFRRLHRWCKTHGAALLVTTTGFRPWCAERPILYPGAVSPVNEGFFGDAAAFFAKEGIPFHDTGSELVAGGRWEDLTITNEGHPNEAGAAKMAELAWQWLQPQVKAILKKQR